VKFFPNRSWTGLPAMSAPAPRHMAVEVRCAENDIANRGTIVALIRRSLRPHYPKEPET